jgi:tRNA pseudouridine55 synthase
VSAIKVDGKRSYARVRAGEDVDLKARAVTVSAFERVSMRRIGDWLDIDVRVECSTGTYVRALARDLGDALGVGGHLTMLRRTRIGVFGVERAASLDELNAQSLIPLTEAARTCFPTVTLGSEDSEHVRHGRQCECSLTELTALLSDTGELLALAEPAGDRLRYLAVFVG